MTPLESVAIFPRTWSVRRLPAPPLIAPARQYWFPQHVPGEEEALQRGAMFLDVKPLAAGNFLARCALGFQDTSLPTEVWSCPHPDQLLAVAGGYAYLLNTQHPEATTLVDQRPVTQVFPVPDQQLLLLAGFHDVLALSAAGLAWRSQRLSWEGIALTGVRGRYVEGTGWDMFADVDRPFRLDLRTGEHLGGGYRASTTVAGLIL